MTVCCILYICICMLLYIYHSFAKLIIKHQKLYYHTNQPFRRCCTGKSMKKDNIYVYYSYVSCCSSFLNQNCEDLPSARLGDSFTISSEAPESKQNPRTRTNGVRQLSHEDLMFVHFALMTDDLIFMTAGPTKPSLFPRRGEAPTIRLACFLLNKSLL